MKEDKFCFVKENCLRIYSISFNLKLECIEGMTYKIVFCLFQSWDAILDGTHPVTLEEAISLAGIQSHIQFEDYNENKHKSGFLE